VAGATGSSAFAVVLGAVGAAGGHGTVTGF
jgi:hypothetical protein